MDIVLNIFVSSISTQCFGLIANVFSVIFLSGLFISFNMPANAEEDFCLTTLASTQEKLEKVKIDLEYIITRNQYQESVTNRYDEIETLLYRAVSCINNKNIPGSVLDQWKRAEKALTALHANAQACAFSKFADWMIYKESDLNAINRATLKLEMKSAPPLVKSIAN